MRCPIHPEYMGINRPKNCPYCFQIYTKNILTTINKTFKKLDKEKITTKKDTLIKAKNAQKKKKKK
jgi:hypothetical protein